VFAFIIIIVAFIELKVHIYRHAGRKKPL